jgi:drug/metabolite transporter (DMT)-like permease
MHSGHAYILLSLLSYSSLGILHKVAEVKNCRALSISLLMCAWCLVFLVAVALACGKELHPSPAVMTLALPFGICAGAAILALQTALSLGNISTSWLAINLSAGIPTILSIVLYKEPVNRWKILALIAMAISMVLLWKDSQVRKAALVSTDS